MAIKPGYKTFTFDGQSSGAYKTYITGSAVYNAPEREVEMIEIPGRNGAFALDKGRFQNIEVTYPAGIYAESQEDFAEALSDLRNMLCSRTGYCRLEDEYNPDEYRMAVYKSGLDVDPAAFQRAGEFEITFECKPQRWLKSGEAKQTIATSGDTITNPTLFESGPLLEVEGYGAIGFNGYEIELNNEILGTVDLFNSKKYNIGAMSTASLAPFTFNADLLNNGDKIEISSKLMNGILGSLLSYSAFGIDTPYVFLENGIYTPGTKTNIVFTSIALTDKQYAGSIGYGSTCRIIIQSAPATFYKGTSATYSASYTHNIKVGNSSYTELYTITVSLQIDISYDGDDTISGLITRTISNDSLGVCGLVDSAAIPSLNVQLAAGVGESSISLLGNPTYIDCDLGECYKFEGGEPVSLNHKIDLGSKLPTLAPGSNAITYDNTITDLKVVPRWWKV